MALLDLPESAWGHATRGRIEHGDSVKVIWNAGPMRFVAAGMVEEKPHSSDDPED